MRLIVWKRPDFGEFACWRKVGEAETAEEAKKLAEEIDRNDCDCSTAVLPEGEYPPGYDQERRFMGRGW